MSRSLRIAVADDEPDMRNYFQKILAHLGHSVVAVAATGRELVQQCRAHHPDLVITDIKMPDLDGIDAAEEIVRHEPTPVILVSGYHDPETIARAAKDHILAYLVKPIEQADLEPAIAVTMERFGQIQALAQETADLRQALEDRKLVERAKGILMASTGVGEQEALRRLQKLASGKNRKLVEVAQMVVTVAEAFQPPQPA